MAGKRHNPERRAWRGRSYKKGGERVADLRDKDVFAGALFLERDHYVPGDTTAWQRAVDAATVAGRELAGSGRDRLVFKDGSRLTLVKVDGVWVEER